ncbi:MAG: peptide-methionine (S)-S-oxide reductase MsrA [Gemmatimonadales bacterium]|nr:peptide-methionine (S)-S-oxide reductase MsrA [Gemmatimonadales bacterium]
MNPDSSSALATLGGGCFWCLEAVFEGIAGVRSVKSGYAGGHVPAPTYDAVCTGITGHAEVVQVAFDPAVLPYRDVLEVFFAAHDPTTLNRQGADRGTQYRSAIFPHDEAQRATAEALIAAYTQERVFADPIVTTIEPLDRFWPAEAYHDSYYRRNPLQPYCLFTIVPKLAKVRQKFGSRLRAGA